MSILRNQLVLNDNLFNSYKYLNEHFINVELDDDELMLLQRAQLNDPFTIHNHLSAMMLSKYYNLGHLIPFKRLSYPFSDADAVRVQTFVYYSNLGLDAKTISSVGSFYQIATNHRPIAKCQEILSRKLIEQRLIFDDNPQRMIELNKLDALKQSLDKLEIYDHRYLNNLFDYLGAGYNVEKLLSYLVANYDKLDETFDTWLDEIPIESFAINLLLYVALKCDKTFIVDDMSEVAAMYLTTVSADATRLIDEIADLILEIRNERAQ